MRITVNPPDSATEADWPTRERRWQRKLGRLRLGVEPLDVQLARYRQVTWMLTAVPSGIGLIILSIFTAFRRPDLGLLIAYIIVVPVVALAWFDYRRLKRLAAAYERERAEFGTHKKVDGAR
jgi:hypothetical protein